MVLVTNGTTAHLRHRRLGAEAVSFDQRRVGDPSRELAVRVRRVDAAMFAAERAAAGTYRNNTLRRGKLKREADVAAMAGAFNLPHLAVVRYRATAPSPRCRRRRRRWGRY